METIKQLVEWSATGIEVATVLLIVVAIAFGSLRFLVHINRHVGDAYERYREHLGKMLILALEFSVAADIIRTLVLEQTLGSIAILGLLVMIRTFLSWSLTVEVEGRWPWSKSEKRIESEVPER